MSIQWYSLSPEESINRLTSSERGLHLKDAHERLQTYGLNSLPETKLPSKLAIFLRQFHSPLIYILLVASFTVFALGETADALIILFVLTFNAVVGMIQEGKAQNTLMALKKFVETNATVVRHGKEYEIPDKEVVPGDVIILIEGQKVPADARILSEQGLKIDESSLTGESQPVNKKWEAINKDDLPTAEQKNMVFKGTHVLSGNGRAVVTSTGLQTVIGKIAKQISEVDTEIPLKVNIRYLSRAIIAVVVSISLVLFIVGIYLGHSAKEMFMTVVSLSVSIIPEGLPIVITLVLATGVWRMSKRNALVKKLQAVEALGQARVIAVDKTGTLTKNELVVRKVMTDGKVFEVTGSGYEPQGKAFFEARTANRTEFPELYFIGQLLSLHSDSRLYFMEQEKKWMVSGDPTEGAMTVFAEKIGYKKEELIAKSPLVAEIPFDYSLKYHAALFDTGEKMLLTVVGAPERLLSLCKTIRRKGNQINFDDKEKKEVEDYLDRMLKEGLRVLAVAINEDFSGELNPDSVKSLAFVGFIGMKDTLRLEVADAMRRAKEAGIRVVMITGDHKVTACAIAEEAGIYKKGDEVITGQELEHLFEAEIIGRLDKTTVFARVTPQDKLEIVNAYKKRGEIVAMTGDGVNDAPSLVAADLGVAMGKIGTEVAKEASDIVLLDDNFGSIISAVEEGRSIYKTIKKVILYLFSTSLGEVLTITAAIFLGLPIPILASQIIWLNFVTDGFLVVALAMDPKEKGLLSEKFERPKKYLVDGLMIERMLFMSVPMMVGALYLFQIYLSGDIMKAWTVSLTTLAVFQWFNAWNCRSENSSVLRLNFFANKYLVASTFVVIALQLFAVYNPFMQKLLRTVPLSLSEWIMIIFVSSSIIFIEEFRKFLSRRYDFRLVRKDESKSVSGLPAIVK